MVDEKKKVNLITQVLIAILPLVGFYAYYRIKKIQLGIAVNFLAAAIFIIPIFLLPPYDEALETDLTLYSFGIGMGIFVWYMLPFYCLLKWSSNWNKGIEERLKG